MEPIERLFWSPGARRVDLDGPWERRVVRPLTKPATALAFDFRAASPPDEAGGSSSR